jgi:hypothetical protein
MAETALFYDVKMRFGEPPKITGQRRVLPRISPSRRRYK